MNQPSPIKFVLTLVSTSDGAVSNVLNISVISKWFRKNHLEIFKTIHLSKSKQVADVFLMYNPQNGFNASETKTLLAKWSGNLVEYFTPLKIDFSLQEYNPVTRKKKVFCSDMDSTMIANETLDDFAYLAGITHEVAKITKLGMVGKIDFKESLNRRLALLKGIKAESLFEQAIDRIKTNPGATTLLTTLRKNKVKTVLVSGGFLPMAQVVQKKLGFDELFCNQFEIINDKLTGNIVGEMVTGEKKLSHYKSTLSKLGLLLEHGLAIGDGANDLPMISAGGLGVAYRAKPLVRQHSHARIEHTDLRSVLYFQGYHENDFVSDV